MLEIIFCGIFLFNAISFYVIASSNKDMLIKKYKVDASRIVSAEGCGVGDLFSEPTWNRVAVSTLSE